MRLRFDRALLVAMPLLYGSTVAMAADEGTGLKTSIAVDTVGKFGDATAGVGESNILYVREAEANFYAPIDPTFDGLLSMAAHREEGESRFEIHEAYISSPRLIPRSYFKVGQFFLGFGRLNQFHRHDWPFITAPKVQADFFAEEAALDTGAEYSYLLPTPFFLQVTAGLTSGWTFGHVEGGGLMPLIPTHYLRAATYFSLGETGGAQTGLNYVGRTSAEGTVFRYYGIDFTSKWREAQVLNFLLQSEVWYRTESPRGAETNGTLGAYFFPQYGFNSNWSLGVRGDYYSVLTLQNEEGAHAGNGTYALVPTLTFKPSEFATLRAAYTRQWDVQPSVPTEVSSAFELQAVFLLGTHPAHDF